VGLYPHIALRKLRPSIIFKFLQKKRIGKLFLSV
jgi:hypothetical protein